MLNILLKVPTVLGADWAWPTRSNLTVFKNYVYLHRFCISEIFVRRDCWTLPHPTWLRTHSLIPTCTLSGWCHGPWNSLVVYLGETTGVSASLDSEIGTGFYKLLSVFDISYTPHMPESYMQTLVNRQNNSKTVSIYFVRIPTGDSLALSTSALF